MILGFTGTRHTPTDEQLTWLTAQLRDDDVEALHHGACVGADACAHRLAIVAGIWVVVHPPMDQRLIDWLAVRPGQTVCEVLPPKHYLARNKDIVNACDQLIAIPNSPYREHSGTWNTVTYARSIDKPIKICFPDGYVE